MKGTDRDTATETDVFWTHEYDWTVQRLLCCQICGVPENVYLILFFLVYRVLCWRLGRFQKKEEM